MHVPTTGRYVASGFSRTGYAEPGFSRTQNRLALRELAFAVE
jgi:hypothetical protein